MVHIYHDTKAGKNERGLRDNPENIYHWGNILIMAKKIQIKEPEAGNMEEYVFRLIERCDERLNDKDNPISHEGFLYYTGARNFLFMLLTGHSNSLSNPNDKTIKNVLRNSKKHVE